MITALTGQLSFVEKDRVHLAVGPIVYEVFVPAIDVPELHVSLSKEITFHTILYLDGDPSRGGMEPKLLGFLRPEDRQFFNLFTTVKGIGPKTALRALTVSCGQIATAIEEKNAKFLTSLNGVGKRTAELIIAELAGKMGDFVNASAMPAMSIKRLDQFEEDAVAALVGLGERRADAERLLERARSSGNHKTTQQLIGEMLRLRA